MDTDIKNAVSATDQDAQYDDKAKRLLGNKIILAHILVKTVDEFRGMNPKDVVSYIEGEPFISVVPVEPGLTVGQVKIINNYVSDVRATGHRYADLSYPAGLKGTVGMLVSLDMVKGVELGEGEDMGK